MSSKLCTLIIVIFISLIDLPGQLQCHGRALLRRNVEGNVDHNKSAVKCETEFTEDRCSNYTNSTSNYFIQTSSQEFSPRQEITCEFLCNTDVSLD